MRTPLRNYGHVSAGGTCPECGKIEFETKADAKTAVRRLPRRKGKLHVYRCPTGSGWWHFGHMPYVVARGMVPRDEFRGSR